MTTSPLSSLDELAKHYVARYAAFVQNLSHPDSSHNGVSPDAAVSKVRISWDAPEIMALTQRPIAVSQYFEISWPMGGGKGEDGLNSMALEDEGPLQETILRSFTAMNALCEQWMETPSDTTISQILNTDQGLQRTYGALVRVCTDNRL